MQAIEDSFVTIDRDDYTSYILYIGRALTTISWYDTNFLLDVNRLAFISNFNELLDEYTIQQIFILGYPAFCLIIVKLIIRINSKGDSILIKLLRHE